jgi:hypothetical protein
MNDSGTPLRRQFAMQMISGGQIVDQTPKRTSAKAFRSDSSQLGDFAQSSGVIEAIRYKRQRLPAGMPRYSMGAGVKANHHFNAEVAQNVEENCEDFAGL